MERFDATGVPLGMMCNSRYLTHRAKLAPGDRLIVYTDGLSESVDAAGEEYGVERLANLVREQHEFPPEALIAGCLADLRQFSSGASRADDLTILAISRAS